MVIRCSVIVPTKDRPGKLLELLNSIKSQTLPTDEWEIIIVDDGSSVACEEIVGNFPWNKIQYKLVKLPLSEGPAFARNVGSDLAKGEILAFTDDDCLVDSEWLSIISKIFDNDTVVGVSGKTIVNHSGRITPYDIGLLGLSTPRGYQTCNIAYRRETFNLIGGFDSRFAKPHREDSDLAMKFLEKGHEIIYSPKMIVFHPSKPKPTFINEIKRIFWSRYDVLLWLKHKKLYGDLIGKILPVSVIIGFSGYISFIFRNDRLAMVGALLIFLFAVRNTYLRIKCSRPTIGEVLRLFVMSIFFPLFYAISFVWGLAKWGGKGVMKR